MGVSLLLVALPLSSVPRFILENLNSVTVPHLLQLALNLLCACCGVFGDKSTSRRLLKQIHMLRLGLLALAGVALCQLTVVDGPIVVLKTLK